MFAIYLEQDRGLLTIDAGTTTAPAETVTVTASFTITESASCSASSSTDNGLPPIYVGPTTTTTTSSSVSACAIPNGQFLIQLDNTNLYLTGEDGPVPEGDTDQRLVTTSDEANAIAFSAATDGNGQVTFVTEDGTTLFSDQDAFLGSGDGPIYWDNFAVSTNGDYFPVQFCLQPDDTFVVQNRLGTDDTSDDANVVQICPDSALYLHSASVAASPRCNTVRLRLVQLNPSYPVTSTSTSSSTSSPTSSPSPSVSACVPVPEGQEFRVSVVGSSEYLTGADGGNLPVSSDGSTLVTTTDYSQAIPFRAALGKNGQITLLNVDGTTLYSDQDLTGSGDEPIYFDTLQTSEDSSMYPVQFCLQSDNTFVVQNLGTQDPNDDANIVQICPGDGAVYLHTTSAAAIRGCSTVRLQIADAPSAASTTTSSAVPTATGYKEGRFRVRMAPPGTEGYMTSFDSDVGSAVPPGVEANFAPNTDQSIAVIFETVPGEIGKVLLYNVNNEPLYLNIDREPGGPVFVNTQDSIDSNRFLPISLFVLQDDSIIVKNLGLDETDPADDSSTILLCASRPVYQMWADNAGAEKPSDCVVQTLIAEFVVDAVTTTSSSPTPTAPPYVPPVGCPATSVQIPENQAFRLKSSLRSDLWLAPTYPDANGIPRDGNVWTTNNIGEALSFTVTPGNTGQLSMYVYSSRFDGQFVASYDNNSGYLYFYPNANTAWPASQFCLGSDGKFTVRSDGADGPGSNDANVVVICPNNVGAPIYMDNGENLAYYRSIGCRPDTLIYDPIT